jgi:hypothetical protein
MTFSNDELFLALVSLVRATRPAMLRQDADGFSIDFEAIAASKSPRDSDRLLLKLGAAMQGPPPAEAPNAGPSAGIEEEGSTTSGTEPEAAAADGAVSLDISGAEASQIAAALAKLEQLQAWPADVLAMSRALRARLASTGGQ